MNLTGYEHLLAQGPFRAHEHTPSFAGISGGRTSAMMAALLDPRVQLCFENTGQPGLEVGAVDAGAPGVGAALRF